MVDIRAKIVLQKRRTRNLTAAEFQDALPSNEKFHAAPEVHRALDEGHAVRYFPPDPIQSWCVKCVGYDGNFQCESAADNAAN